MDGASGDRSPDGRPLVLIARPEGMVQVRGHFLSRGVRAPALPADACPDLRTVLGSSLSGAHG